MDTIERSGVDQSTAIYDGFLSYSHAADDLLAPRLQSGLQRFAKPWWKRRALRIFRDESSLSANPHLWSSITEALDQSGWFVLLLSPDAAQSEWVNQEIEYWKEHKDPSRILPVLTDGTFQWTDGDVSGTAVPEQLQGAFAEEPRWVDMRFAKDEEQLTLKNPGFSAAVADIASALRDVPKDELESEEVREHRRTVRTAWGAAALVGMLALAATIFAVQAASERDRAEAEAARAEANAAAEAEARAEAQANAEEATRNAELAQARELAASAIGVLDKSPELSTLLAIEAINSTPEGVEQPLEVINALWQAGNTNRLVDVFETGHESTFSLSGDGTRLAVTTAHNELQMLEASTGEPLWAYSEDTVDFFTYSDFSGDGRLALSVIDSSADAAPELVEDTDSHPNRLLILDTETGESLHTIEIPECVGAEVPSWSPDGSYLALSSGLGGCPRNDTIQWLEVFETSNWDSVAFLPIEGDHLGPIARWDAAGRLYSLRPFGSAVVFEAETFDQLRVLEANGIGDVTPDGSHLVLSSSEVEGGISDFNTFRFDAESGELRDIYPGDTRPALPKGIEVSADGRYAIVGTSGASTLVYEIGSGAELFDLPTGEIFSLGFDPETERLYTSGANNGVWVWDLSASTAGVSQTGDLGNHEWVNGNSFFIGPQMGAFNAVDFADFTWAIKFFDPATGELHPDVIEDAATAGFLSTGQLLGFDYGRQRNVLIDIESGQSIELDACQESEVDDDGGLVCVGEDDPNLYYYHVSHDGSELLAIGHHEPGQPSKHLASLDPETGQVAERLEVDTGLPRPAITAEWAIGQTRDRGVLAVDRDSGEILYDGPSSSSHYEVSPSAFLVAMNPRSTDLLLVDTNSWEEVFTIQGTARIRGLAFNPDETRIAVGDLDSLYVVDIESGLIVQQMRLPGVSDIHWLDDDTVLVGTNDGLFGTVSLSTEAFLQQVRDRLRRSFTEQECAAYHIDPCPTLAEMKDG